MTSAPTNPLSAQFTKFAAQESAGGIVLMTCAILALLWANSPWASTYDAVWHFPIAVGTESFGIRMSAQHWINDALMAIFFVVVGLEIKRELLIGELTSLKLAALPIAGALGGMIVPALLYASLNASHPGSAGWGIPMATDIAFALGVLALLGPRVPPGLKIFLLALAIVDDLGAVLVIACFYTHTILWSWLALSIGAIGIAALGNAIGIRQPILYLVAGLVAWIGMFHSGVHATIASVLLAFTIPMPFARVEHLLHGVVTFCIMPIFALANAGIALTATTPTDGATLVTMGIILGLVIGKPLGITACAWLAVRLGAATLPTGASWRAVHSVSWLGGIGFTMSLFIAGLAFGDGPLLAPAKLGILAASSLAGLGGWLLYIFAVPSKQ